MGQEEQGLSQFYSTEASRSPGQCDTGVILVRSSLHQTPFAQTNLRRCKGSTPKAVAVTLPIPKVVIDAGPLSEQREADEPEDCAKDFQTENCPAVVQLRPAGQGDMVVGEYDQRSRGLCTSLVSGLNHYTA